LLRDPESISLQCSNCSAVRTSFNLFFQVISARHDQKLGTIATTNIPFGKFNQIFANDAIAHAIVDRLVNEAEVFYLEGTSYREYQREEKQKTKAK